MSPSGPRDTSDAALLRTFKQELRRVMLTTRGALPRAALRERAEAARDRLLAEVDLSGITRVIGFVAVKGELDPSTTLAALAAKGLEVGLPCIERATGTLLFRADVGPRVVGAFGIQEPPSTAPAWQPDAATCVLVPAVAIDSRGHRLGMGRGFYDRALAGSEALRVAFVHDFQLVDEVPSEPHDLPVRLAVTERRVVRFG